MPPGSSSQRERHPGVQAILLVSQSQTCNYRWPLPLPVLRSHIACTWTLFAWSQIPQVLLSKHFWKGMSAADIQQICAGFVAGGEKHADVIKMASLGNWGRNPNHIREDLERALPPSLLSQALKTIQVPFKAGVDQMKEHPVAIVQPHVAFHLLYHHRRTCFFRIFMNGSTANLQRFWDDMEDHPNLKDHPCTQRTNYKQLAVPIEVHFDGIPVTAIGRKAAQSAIGYSWKSMAVMGNPAMLRMLIGFLWKSMCIKEGKVSQDRFWLHVCYSLYWLYMGVWPWVDEHDAPLRNAKQGELADGFFCPISSICSDLVEVEGELGLNSATSGRPCVLCNADEGGAHWNQLRPNAAWMRTIWTANLWRARMTHRHRLLGQPGVSALSYAGDLMHNKHLGSDQRDYGSTIKLLTHHLMPGTPEQNIEAFMEHLKTAYTDYLTESLEAFVERQQPTNFLHCILPSSCSCLPAECVHAGTLIGSGATDATRVQVHSNQDFLLRFRATARTSWHCEATQLSACTSAEGLSIVYGGWKRAAHPDPQTAQELH